MNFLETKDIVHNDIEYTLRLAQQKNDHTKYAFIIQNKITGKSAKYEFTEEISFDFSQFNNESLFEYLPKQIQLDLESGII